MAVYWLSFRIADDAGYTARYQALIDAVAAIQTKWWMDTTSFFVFESTLAIGDVAGDVRAAIDPAKDVALLGMPDFKSGRIIGAYEDDEIFELMPFIKKV